jgi:hypothetical protein
MKITLNVYIYITNTTMGLYIIYIRFKQSYSKFAILHLWKLDAETGEHDTQSMTSGVKQ